MLTINKIYCIDCLKGLKQLDDNSIDLIITDPPYNISGKSANCSKVHKNINEKNTWDIFDKDEYEEFTISWVKECIRVLKNSGSMYIFQDRLCKISNFIEKHFDKEVLIRDTLVWHKTNPCIISAKNSYLSSTEFIGYFVKKDKNKMVFNFDRQNTMHNMIETSICMGKERTEHPTQKILKLVRKLIEISSNKNSIVLDPFIGSGTTAVASKQLGRHYIGFEILKKYVNISNNRLKEVDKMYKMMNKHKCPFCSKNL